MRYIVADERTVTLDDVRAVFTNAGAEYEVDGDDVEATITLRGRAVGQIVLNLPGDGLFDGEIEELIEFAKRGQGKGLSRVTETLRAARQIVAVQVLFGGDDVEPTLAAIDPLWRWLHENRTGLAQADGEGYYDAKGLILALR
jgi:hypothetical protein